MDNSSADQTESLAETLRPLTVDEPATDPLVRAAYSTDASVLEVRPLAVLTPRSAEEVAAIVRHAAAGGLSIHARGAGTGLAGESLGSGLMLDFTKHMNRILEVGPDWILVEPGACYLEVQRALAPTGRMLAVDPISGDRCTLGGMLATNAAGPHSLRYGATRDHVLAVRAVLASGDIVDFEPTLLETRESTDTGPAARIQRQLARVLSAYAQAIAEEQSATLIKHGGYELRGAFDGRTIDLPRILAGSEGTLALTVAVKLATVPIPAFRGMLLATFPTLSAAAEAVIESLEYQPTACELLDRRLLSLVREAEPWYHEWITRDAEALLLIEHQGNSPENVVERIVLNQNRIDRIKRLALETQEVYGEADLARCWSVRDRAMPRLTRSSDNVLPTPFVENTAVPPAQLPAFLAKVQGIMQRHGLTATYSAHAGVGILHARPMLDIHREQDRKRMTAVVEDMFEAVISCQGTFNGEHGAGLLRSGLLRQQYPKLFPAFERIKAIFDPENILNPGRIVGAETSLPTGLIRGVESPTPLPESKTALRWPKLSMLATADRCNGCGSCGSKQFSARMCPTARAEPGEFNAPRAIANVMRQVLHGQLEEEVKESAEFKALVNHCVYCKMCRTECPSSVDISRLALEAKASQIAEFGMSRTDWFFTDSDSWSAWGSEQAHFVNRVLGNPLARWLLERFSGLSRRRRLFRFHHHTFLRRAKELGWSRKPTSRNRMRIALFVDSYTNYHDPDLGEYSGRLLALLGSSVYVPPSQRSSGMTFLQYGNIERARAALLWNFEIAAELVREGFTIVTTEPAAALMLRDEARHLIADTDLDPIAENTFELTEYLATLADRGDLPTPTTPIPVGIGYHEPCHERALELRGSPLALLQKIPEARIIEMDLGCSGMAGTHGMRADQFASSLKSGSALLGRLARGDLLAGTTQCGACRMQMEQGAGKPTVPTAKLLAASFGLVDRPDRLFRRPNRGLIASTT